MSFPNAPGASEPPNAPYSVAPFNLWLPSDSGWLTWAFDPAVGASAGDVINAGTLYLIAMKLAVPATITNLIANVVTAGATLTAGQCFAALYAGMQAGAALLGTTADQSTAWASAGVKTMPLGSPVAVPAGIVALALWANGTTPPAFARAGEPGGLPASTANQPRFATANTGLTTTAPATLGAITSTFRTLWGALS